MPKEMQPRFEANMIYAVSNARDACLLSQQNPPINLDSNTLSSRSATGPHFGSETHFAFML
jgi:hypothetical protein